MRYFSQVPEGFNWLDYLKEQFGGQAEVTLAVIAAEANPTAANVRNVVAAYAAHGIVPPADLLSHLKELNESVYPNDPAFPNPLPWLVFGGAVLYVALR